MESVYSFMLILVFLCQHTLRVEIVREWACRRSNELYMSLMLYDPSSSESASNDGRLIEGGGGYLDCQNWSLSSGGIDAGNPEVIK